MKKILIIYHYFPHYRLPILKALSKQVNEGFEYTFLSGFTTDVPLNILKKEDVSTLNFISAKNKWFFNKILWQTKVLRHSISSEYDCIIYLGSPNFITTWLGAIIAKIIGKPTLFWTHGFLNSRNFRDRLKKIFFSIPKGLLLYGNNARNNLISRGFKSESLFVIYNSLDYNKQIEIKKNIKSEDVFKLKKQLFKNSNLPVIIFIGRLTYQKKLNDIVVITQKLHNQGIPINVLFVGDGIMRDDLNKSVEQNSLSDYFTFFGKCHDEHQLAHLITLSDICVSPGEVGLTAIHSLVYGTPVISHDCNEFQMPEYEAIVDGVNGGLYKYGSLESLYHKVKEWLVKDNSQETKDNFSKIIDDYYNPNIQSILINKAVKEIVNEK
jgi:glycosyltransferase involved in cell wall biosynthesis|tara:strand:- start:696 stop:1838 length:1143 start_codon:yes stop_codon:yes gene_type:complete